MVSLREVAFMYVVLEGRKIPREDQYSERFALTGIDSITRRISEKQANVEEGTKVSAFV
jgi:hypothetical protein